MASAYLIGDSKDLPTSPLPDGMEKKIALEAFAGSSPRIPRWSIFPSFSSIHLSIDLVPSNISPAMCGIFACHQCVPFACPNLFPAMHSCGTQCAGRFVEPALTRGNTIVTPMCISSSPRLCAWPKREYRVFCLLLCSIVGLFANLLLDSVRHRGPDWSESRPELECDIRSIWSSNVNVGYLDRRKLHWRQDKYVNQLRECWRGSRLTASISVLAHERLSIVGVGRSIVFGNLALGRFAEGFSSRLWRSTPRQR